MFFFQQSFLSLIFFNTDTLLKDFHLKGETVPQKGNNKSFVLGCLMLLQLPVFWSSCIL